MPIIYNYEDAIRIFNENEFILLSSKEEFVNARTRLKYKCLKCGHEGKRCISEFSDGRGCVNCFRLSQIGKGSKYTYEDVFKIFADSGCVLLSNEYINQFQILKFKCSCGNIGEKPLKTFLKSKQCKKCGRKQAASSKKCSFEEVKEFFEKYNYELLTTEYLNAHQKLQYRCPKGHIDEMTFNHFKSGKRCPDCFRVKQSEMHRLEIEVVSEKFEEKGFVLLTDNYINSHQKLKYLCHCGDSHYTTYANLRHIDNCPKISKGENEIKNFLQTSSILYQSQYSFPDCKNINVLLFDFAIFDNDNNLICLIEYDGEQHFFPVDFAGKGEDWANEQFKIIQKHDQIKNQYCNTENIPLLRIPYWDFTNINNLLYKFINLTMINKEGVVV